MLFLYILTSKVLRTTISELFQRIFHKCRLFFYVRVREIIFNGRESVFRETETQNTPYIYQFAQPSI